jgi:hypothetical protein
MIKMMIMLGRKRRWIMLHWRWLIPLITKSGKPPIKKCMAFIKNTIEQVIVGSIVECHSVWEYLER